MALGQPNAQVVHRSQAAQGGADALLSPRGQVTQCDDITAL